MKTLRVNTPEVSGRELLLTRVLDAPRELVWKAWTDPEHLSQWWGPNGFSTTTSEMNVKPGGHWRFVMHGPDGRDYKNLITYLEVVHAERLVYKHGGEAEVEPVHFQVFVAFADENGGTLLTMRMAFDTPEELVRVDKEYGAIEGAKQTLARLAEHLAQMAG